MTTKYARVAKKWLRTPQAKLIRKRLRKKDHQIREQGAYIEQLKRRIEELEGDS